MQIWKIEIMRNIILSIIGLLLFQSIYSQNTENINWNMDLDFLAKQLPEKHYNLFAIQSKADFLMGINAIKSETSNSTDLQTALNIQQLIARLGDSHTSLNFKQLLDRNKVLPLGLFWLSDGLYIIRTNRENEKLLGCQWISVNEIPITTVIDSLSTLFTVDNQAILKAQIPQFIPIYQILEYFGFANNQPVKLGIKTQSNESLIYPIEPTSVNKTNAVYLELDSLPFYLEKKKAYFEDSYQPQDRIFYMLYNVCWSRELEAEYGNKEKAEELPSFKEFEERAFQALNKGNIDKIIFDIRSNGGGHSMQGTAFIEKLAAFLKSNPEIKTYVVLGRNTFSSAILNALDFKRLTNAVFVGEETSGKPNHFGEVRDFQLPSSKLSVSYSTKYFKFTDGDMNTLTPDVLIETSFANFTKGIDPVYEWVKKQ